MAKSLPVIQPRRGRSKTPTAFSGMRPAGLTDLTDQRIKLCCQSAGHLIQVIPLNRVIAGIVFAGNKPAACGNIQSTRQQTGPYLGTIGHGGKNPCIRTAMPAGTGTAIVSRAMRIILAARAVAKNQHQRRVVFGQADAAQKCSHPVHLFDIEKAGLNWRTVLCSFCSCLCIQGQACAHRPIEQAPDTISRPSIPGRGQTYPEQPGQCRHAGQGSDQRPGDRFAPGRLIQTLTPFQSALPALLVS